MIDKTIFFSAFCRPHRLIRIIFYKIGIYRDPSYIIINTKYGFPITIVLPELVSKIIYLTGGFEESVEKIIGQFVKPGDVVVDVGAHIGYFSILMSRQVGKDGKVYAFEPTPSTYALLKQNCLSFTNIHVVNKAVFSKITKLKLQDFGILYLALNSLFSPRINKKLPMEKREVETIDLDTYFSKSEKPNFIKIDAENSEYEIIKGMENLLRTKRPTICMEFGGCGKKSTKNSKELLDFLYNAKYEIFYFNRGAIKTYSLSEGKNHYENLLCIPK